MELASPRRRLRHETEPAQRMHRELKDPGLPTLNDIAGGFENEAQKLGVA